MILNVGLISRLATNFLDICIATEEQKLKDIQIKLSAKKVYVLLWQVKDILKIINQVIL